MMVLIPAVGGCAAISGGAHRDTSAELRLEDVADLSRLDNALAEVAFLTSGADTGLVSIRYDSLGAYEGATFSHPAANEAEAKAVEHVFSLHLEPRGPISSSAWLMVVRGVPPRLEPFKPARESMPQLRNRTYISRLLEQLAERPGFRTRKTTFKLLIDTSGEVREAGVETSSGSSEVDRAMLEVARQAQFTPARLDRFPVSVWLRLPLAIEERSTRRR